MADDSSFGNPYRAILFSNGDYRSKRFVRLKHARADLETMQRALSSGPRSLPFEVETHLDLTGADLRAELHDFLQNSTSADHVVIYFSGHGYRDDTDEFYMCGVDSDPRRLPVEGGVSADQLRRMCEVCEARSIVVILDCCHAGAVQLKSGAEARDLPQRLAGSGRYVLAACRASQRARAELDGIACSPFTHYLAEATSHGAATTDGYVEFSSVAAYVGTRIDGCGQTVVRKVSGASGNEPVLAAGMVVESGRFPQPMLAPKPILGEAAGEAEWVDSEGDYDAFLCTESYTRFRDPSLLYVFGRRGTGKTSLLRKLERSVLTGNDSEYFAVWNPPSGGMYGAMCALVQASSLASATEGQRIEALTRIWVWLYTVSAMIGAMRWGAPGAKLKLNEREIEDYLAIVRYLRSIGAAHLASDGSLSAERYLEDCLLQQLHRLSGRGPQGTIDFRNFRVALFAEREWAEASEALGRLCAGRNARAAVMLDSVDHFDWEDAFERSVAAAAVEAAYRMRTDRRSLGVSVKLAFPSDHFPRLPRLNQDKLQPHSMFVEWSYGDLISLLAKRYFVRVAGGRDEVLTKAGELDDPKAARAYLYEHFLPATVEVTSNFEFDALAYLIRFTQRKPRQLIVLMNSVLTLAGRHDEPIAPLSAKILARGLEQSLDLLVDGVLDSMKYFFSSTHEQYDVTALARALLGNRPATFTHAELIEMLRHEKTHWRKMGLDMADVRELLIRSGMLGEKVGSSSPNGERSVKIWECRYQYQVPHPIQFNQATVWAVHPMFHRALNLKARGNLFVYPGGLVEDQEAARVR